ncbi:MAG TPA: apolipoprotein N-acyltransferase, partial [Myxococcota bacterium]|nr:apolipoprotein N-acyltransferase [Myxococcota bacterium]
MVLALKGALFFTLARFLSTRFNLPFLAVAPFALCAGEYFRNYYIFGGFPWGNVGYSVGRIDEILQVGSLVGVYGLVFIVGVVNAVFAYAWKTRGWRHSYLFAALGVFIVFGSFIYGALRLHYGADDFAPTLRVALLQGDIPQEIKSASRLHASEILDIYLGLQQEAIDQGAELVIWPESSYPRLLNENITSLSKVSDFHVASIVGSSVYGESPNAKDYYARNSALLIDYNGVVVKRYDKSHLVPFGEYVPWPMTGVVDKIVPGLGAFLPGVEFAPADLSINLGKKIAVGATVCYEGIFPEISRSYAMKGASLLVNITNDAWYGFSSAPYQHLLMYKLRSVETGLPFVRATNSGISAWIDSFGRIHQPLGLFERGLVVGNIPLLKKSTVYVAVGDIIAQISLILLLVGYLLAVLPIHTYFKNRQWWKLLVVFALSTVALASYVYFSGRQFAMVESARTKSLLVLVFSFLLMIGLLSKTKRSRTILLVFSAVIVICSCLLAIFESLSFLVGLVFGLLLYVLAFRIKETDKPV